MISLHDFKAIMGVDDREDKTASYCLEASTVSIEEYCLRQFIKTKIIEEPYFFGDMVLPLSEYPVREILAVYFNGEIVEPDFYCLIPSCGRNTNKPHNLTLSLAYRRFRKVIPMKIIYIAGFNRGKAPPDLKTACLELATWNMSRYKGRRVGMTGNIRGSGRDGEHFELSMPENVKALLEPYRRKTI